MSTKTSNNRRVFRKAGDVMSRTVPLRLSLSDNQGNELFGHDLGFDLGKSKLLFMPSGRGIKAALKKALDKMEKENNNNDCYTCYCSSKN